MRIAKATVGSTYLTTDRIRKDGELTEDAVKAAKTRLKFYKKRDEDKERNDVARNDFESLVYAVRSWLREDENEAYVAGEEREEKVEYLNEMEEWLYDDGAEANFTVLEGKTKDLTKSYEQYTNRKTLHENLDAIVETTRNSIQRVNEKVAALQIDEKKAHIADEEWQDILDTASDVSKWLDEAVEKQSTQAKHEEPTFDEAEMNKKVNKLTKLFQKVSKKRPPVPKKEKEEKVDLNLETDEAEDFNDGEEKPAEEQETAEQQAEEAQTEEKPAKSDDL